MFRFIIGLVTGVAIGVAAATMSQGKSGQDLRAEFERFRSDLQQGDFDAVGARLEAGLKDLQSSLEARFAEFQSAASEMADDIEDEVEEAAADVDDLRDEVEATAGA